ncbi:MAG: response regulator [Thermoflexales bacterium]|nr:response regulator [Thermoflexales bacterium]
MADKITVLIVDDIPETRENVRKLLMFEKDITVVDAAGSGNEGIKLAAQYRPNVVLMDINMPDIDGITAVEAIIQQTPTTQVVMMSVQSEAGYMQRAMEAGARGYLTKPFTGDELVSTVRRVYKVGQARMPAMAAPVAGAPVAGAPAAAGAPRQKRGHVVAVVGSKGGVGTSVVTVNLALALHSAGHKVAVMDASLEFSNVGVLLNLQASRSIGDLIQVADEIDPELVENTLTPHPSGVKAMLAPASPEMAELVTAELLKSILHELSALFDFVIVDTPKSLHERVLTIMDEAERVVLLSMPDIPTLKNTRDLFGVLDALKYPSSKMVFVLNKMDRRAGITAKDVSDNLKHPVAVEIPLDEAIVMSSINRGIPFVADQRAKPVARALIQLAEFLVRDLTAVPEPVAPVPTAADDAARSRLGRLMGR